MKKIVFVFALMLAVITATEQARACDMCGQDKVLLIDEVESIVQHIEHLNAEAEYMKGNLSADALAAFNANQQKKKQQLINLAVRKVQSI